MGLGSLKAPSFRKAMQRSPVVRASDGLNVQESLVTIAPGVVAGADVLVGVLGALLKGREVGPVLPMLVVEGVGVVCGEGKGRGDAAGERGEFR